jgi:heme A synthase
MKRFVVVLACLTFVLLLMGGLVHNTRSSLACPDWPLCFGQVFPKMEGGVLVEHSHRLMAATVALLTAILTLLCAVRAQRTGDWRLLWLGLGAFVCVATQATLGGITVLYRLPTIVSTAHLAVSMIFFSLLIYVAFRLREPAARLPLSRRAQRATAAAAALVYLQMLLGALMRHLGAGLACTDLPLCRGQLWPTGVHPNVLLHVTHRLFALVVLGHVIAAAVITFRAAAGRRAVRALALAAPLLATVQIVLGVLSITSFLDVVPVTAHLGGAALLLADLVSLHLIARGELHAPSEPVAAPLSSPREAVA